jgi:L-seryl-tRNA(Ser) seleniumtransferase
MASTLSIIPYQMMPGEEKIVAERIYSLLSQPPKLAAPEPAPSGATAAIAGQWEVRLEFGRGSATHTVFLEQDGSKLAGSHRGEFHSGDLAGTVAANTVRFRSSHRVHGTRLGYDFTGMIAGDQMTGHVNMGEYGITPFTAQKHKYPAEGTRRPG